VIRATGIVAVSLALLGAGSARALTLQPVGSFEQPTYVTSDPGNPDRLFVVERKGRIKEVENGAISTFADISGLVSCCEGERGLLSIALAPDFDTSGRLYVDYTGKEEPGEIHVAELLAGAGGAVTGTPRQVLTIPHPAESNHNGGQLQFGPDGYLYISSGDGGGANDVHHNAQRLDNLLGKILRINPRQSGALAYTVPAGNPFLAKAGARGEIWSYGLRNPFRFSFDRLSGDLVIGDVGQSAREEVDYAPAPLLGAGADYGWNCREGFVAGPGTDPECSTPPLGGFTEPVFDYPHTAPAGGTAPCAIIGGYVVRDRSLGDLYGRYLYGDLCGGGLRSLNLANPLAGDRSEGVAVTKLNSFGEDSCGRLYVVEEGGRVSRLVGASPASCPVPVLVQPIVTRPQPAATFIGIKPQRRRVERGKTAVLTVWVSPCRNRKGDTVVLLRNGHRNGSRFLSRACTARFLRRVHRNTGFAAATYQDSDYLAGKSRRLKIRIESRHRAGRRR
jgi:Glucose / Sorbosone dehydrogenase